MTTTLLVNLTLTFVWFCFTMNGGYVRALRCWGMRLLQGADGDDGRVLFDLGMTVGAGLGVPNVEKLQSTVHLVCMTVLPASWLRENERLQVAVAAAAIVLSLVTFLPVSIYVPSKQYQHCVVPLLWSALQFACGWQRRELVRQNMAEIIMIWSAAIGYFFGLSFYITFQRVPKLSHAYRIRTDCLPFKQVPIGWDFEHGNGWPSNRRWPPAFECQPERWLLKWAEAELNVLSYAPEWAIFTGLAVLLGGLAFELWRAKTEKKRNQPFLTERSEGNQNCQEEVSGIHSNHGDYGDYWAGKHKDD